MALLFMDSFDHYATADLVEKWSTAPLASTAGGTLTVNASGRHASSALRWVTGTGNVSGGAQRVLAPSSAKVVLGFAYNPVLGPSTAALGMATISDGATAQVHLRLNTNGTLSVFRGDATGTVLGTTTATVTANTYVYVELAVLIANTGGTVDLRLNGASVLALTAQDTQNTATTQWTSIFLGHSSAATAVSSNTRTFDFDDVYVLDGAGAAPWNAFLGDVRVDARLPTGAGATTGWTPLAGANWDAVNDATPDDDTTYTATATVGATDTYVTQDAAIVGAVIYGVQHCLSMKKTDAGVCTVVPVIRHAGVDVAGAALNPSTAYGYGVSVQATNPGTGAAWTEAGFNAAEFGFKRTV